MKALIVKTSSMGDLIHTLPAVTDALNAVPGLRFDWVAEDSFAEIPAWHPAVDDVIPIAIRKWRRDIVRSVGDRSVCDAVTRLRETEYDYIIDAQGLIKSALVTVLAKGESWGMDFNSCREPAASLFYGNKIKISKRLHAIERVRILFARILGYRYDEKNLDYGIDKNRFARGNFETPYLVFLHGTSRESKLWPAPRWRALAELAEREGYAVYLPWGNDAELVAAREISFDRKNAVVLSKLSLGEIAGLLSGAAGVVGVDTGLAHLAAALQIPSVTLYIETYPSLTGACGLNQTCISQKKIAGGETPTAGLATRYLDTITAEAVWGCLRERL